MKFCFTNNLKLDSLEIALKGLDTAKLLHYLGTLRPGTKMHLIVRPRPGFNVEGMRNYFHGPMLDWVLDRIHNQLGIPCSRVEIRDEFKKKFIGVNEEGKPLSIAKTLEIKVEGDPRDPETKYKEFLTDVRQWCIEVFNDEPPWPDECDLNEESNVCPIPEKTK